MNEIFDLKSDPSTPQPNLMRTFSAMRLFMAFFAALHLPSCVAYIEGGRNCATHVPTETEIEKETVAMRSWSASDSNMTKRQTVNIETYWNTITSNGEGSISDPIVKQSIDILDAAFSPDFRFTLVGDPKTTENSSYWGIGVGQDNAMKSKLRKGNCGALNIYSTELSSGLLGWATFPNECGNDRSYDGVVILHSSVPGGSAVPYNEGDTLTHEVGHWLGLYHTFDGGCGAQGDAVDDTPAVAQPNNGCPTVDSCPDDGLGNDQVENFMDYTDDSCMTTFTTGQFKRMVMQWDMYRSDGSPPTPNPPTPKPPTPKPPTPKPPTPTPPTPKPPTPKPPTPSPPTINPPSNCPTGKPDDFQVEVQTDDFGEDIFFYLRQKKNKKKGFKRKKIFKKRDLASSTNQIFRKCLPKNKTYKFFMTDSQGDGLCCGSGQGYYKLSCNGNTFYESKFEDDDYGSACMETKKFSCT